VWKTLKEKSQTPADCYITRRENVSRGDAKKKEEDQNPAESRCDGGGVSASPIVGLLPCFRSKKVRQPSDPQKNHVFLKGGAKHGGETGGLLVPDDRGGYVPRKQRNSPYAGCADCWTGELFGKTPQCKQTKKNRVTRGGKKRKKKNPTQLRNPAGAPRGPSHPAKPGRDTSWRKKRGERTNVWASHRKNCHSQQISQQRNASPRGIGKRT